MAATREQLKQKASDLRRVLVQAERAVGIVSDAERKSSTRAAVRDLKVPPVKEPARREDLRNDPPEWLRFYLPHVFYNPFTPSQLRQIEEFTSALRYGSRKCEAAPRSDGKSTIIKYLTLMLELERLNEFTLVLAATGEKSHRMLGDIKRQLRNTRCKNLHDDYPLETTVARYIGSAPARAHNVTAGGRPIRVEWQQNLIVLPSYEDEDLGGIIMSHGITSDAVQGCNYNDIRPSFVILDDLDSRDSLAAVDGKIAEKIETIIDHTVAGLGGPGRRLGQVMLCTIPSRNSVAFRYSDPTEKPAWSGVRSPRILKWPTRKDLWDEYMHLRSKGKGTFRPDGKPIDPHGREAHRFYEANRAAMDEGAELSNVYDFEADIMPDGTPKHLSALQKCYDYISDNTLPSFLTEHQNDPPADDQDANKLILTAHHIQHNCLSGLERRIVPDGTVLMTLGGDLQKRGIHWVLIAWNEQSAGCIVDYDFFSFGTEGRDAADCELAILEGLWAWHAALQEHPYLKADGELVPIDLALLDMGWKDESWNTQPVQSFCNALGNREFMPSKGMANYRRPKESRATVIGDNWHVTFPAPFVAMNSDHWKLKVHEGFLCDRGATGSLSLFNQPLIDGRPNRNFHLSYSKHILAESWETRTVPGFRRPETKWWHFGKPNHYFDATYQAIVARSVRGLNVLAAAQVPGTTQSTPAQPSEQPPRPEANSRRRINFRRRA